jgi:hypothetical protein
MGHSLHSAHAVRFDHRVCESRDPDKRSRNFLGDVRMSNIHSYEALEADYGTDNFRRSEPIKAGRQQAPSHGRRRGKSPTSVNGIHRRRRRKISW